MKLDPLFITLLLGTLIPAVRSVIVKCTASQSLKTAMSVALAAGTGVVTAVSQNGGLLSKQVVVSALLAFFVAQAAHYGFWSPTGIDGKLNAATVKFGLGKYIAELDPNTLRKLLSERYGIVMSAPEPTNLADVTTSLTIPPPTNSTTPEVKP